MATEKKIKWKLPKKRQPIWAIFKAILRPLFFIKNVEFWVKNFLKSA